MAKIDLAAHVGQLVMVEGTFSESYSRNSRDERLRRVKVAVMVHLRVSGDFPGFISVTHSHVQFADAILDERPKRGDKIRFLAEVYSYLALDRETDQRTIPTFGLSNPTDVEIYEVAPAVQPAEERPTTTRTPLLPVSRLTEPPGKPPGVIGKVKKVDAVREALSALGQDATLEEVRNYVFEKYTFSPTSSTVSNAKRALKDALTNHASPAAPAQPAAAAPLRSELPHLVPGPVESMASTGSASFGDAVELLNSVRSVGPDAIRAVLELEKRVGGPKKLQQIVELLR